MIDVRLVGADGRAVRLTEAGELIVGPERDFMLEVSQGNVPGHAGIEKFGTNPNVTTATEEEIWDDTGVYTYPTTATATHIGQAVDQVAMRGETIEVHGLDATYEFVIQAKALDGANTTTLVALDTPLLRPFRMRVLADVVTDQDVHLQNVGGTTTYALIQAGNNQTAMALYTVPADKTAFITNYYADVVVTAAKDPKSTNFKLWVADRASAYEFQMKHAQSTAAANPNAKHRFEPYLEVTQKSDIKMTALPIDKDAHVNGGFDLILVDN